MLEGEDCAACYVTPEWETITISTGQSELGPFAAEAPHVFILFTIHAILPAGYYLISLVLPPQMLPGVALVRRPHWCFQHLVVCTTH